LPNEPNPKMSFKASPKHVLKSEHNACLLPPNHDSESVSSVTTSGNNDCLAPPRDAVNECSDVLPRVCCSQASTRASLAVQGTQDQQHVQN